MSTLLKLDICSFEDWLFSLSHTLLEFLHVFSGLIFSFLFTTTLWFPEWLSQLIHGYSWWMASWLFSTSENYTHSGSEHSCLDLCLDFRYQHGDCWSLVFSYEGNATLIYTVYTSLDSHYRPNHCTSQPTCTMLVLWASVILRNVLHLLVVFVCDSLLTHNAHMGFPTCDSAETPKVAKFCSLSNQIMFHSCLKFLSYFQYMCFIWYKILSPRLYRFAKTCNFLQTKHKPLILIMKSSNFSIFATLLFEIPISHKIRKKWIIMPSALILMCFDTFLMHLQFISLNPLVFLLI